MSVRGVLISRDSIASIDEFPVELSPTPKTPKLPRSPHSFINRVDYFTRGELLFHLFTKIRNKRSKFPRKQYEICNFEIRNGRGEEQFEKYGETLTICSKRDKIYQ